MRKARRYGHILGLVAGVLLGLLPVLADVAAAQELSGENCGILGIVCLATENETGAGGNATGGDGGNGGRGGNGGFAALHDVANASSDTSNSVIAGDITTEDASAPDISVDGSGVTGSVLVIVGNFPDMGEDVFEPGVGGGTQQGTTGGAGVGVDESGGNGGNGGDRGNASGGDGRGIHDDPALTATDVG